MHHYHYEIHDNSRKSHALSRCLYLQKYDALSQTVLPRLYLPKYNCFISSYTIPCFISSVLLLKYGYMLYLKPKLNSINHGLYLKHPSTIYMLTLKAHRYLYKIIPPMLYLKHFYSIYVLFYRQNYAIKFNALSCSLASTNPKARNKMLDPKLLYRNLVCI